MRLKRVRIFGFKTFADKTELDLDGDLIAIVGPNGCGKSNIVDAIMWGLGEPNARNIRAQSSSEIIFSGSQQRKPLGYAEVSMLFDNEDGALGVDAPEVLVSRKVSRNGESDYAINRRSCRQKDVYDLFADSGLGRTGYAIVTQKGIDAALAASPDERRAWVDEAAGVQRYRTKRIESLKRLDAAVVHLQRVEDILREIELQRGPLAEEAEVAKRYRLAAASLREIEAHLMILEVSKAVTQLQDLEKRLKGHGELAEQEGKRAAEAEAAANDLGRSLSSLEQEMDSLRDKHQAALTAVERAQGAVQLAEQRLKSLDDFEGNMSEESEAAQRRLLDARTQVSLAVDEQQREVEALDRLRAELAGAGSEASLLRKDVEVIESRIAKASQQHAARLQFEAEAAHRSSRLGEIQRELKGIDDALPNLQQGVDEAHALWETWDAKVKEASQLTVESNEALRSLKESREGTEKALRQVLQQLASIEGRVRGITATVEAHEGLTHGSRAVFTAVEQGLLKGTYVPVAEAIDTEKRFALAIEIALGGAFDDLIVPDERTAKAAIEVLKSNRLGRATFQPVSLMRPRQRTPELDKAISSKGVLGVASELVKCSKQHRPVIDSLLGRVVVVSTLEEALALAKSSGWSKLVTLEGELIQASGAVTGGSRPKVGGGIIQRKSELRELELSLAELEKEADAYRQNLASAEQDQLKWEEASEKWHAAEAENRSEADDARQWLTNLRHELQGTERARARLAEELAKLNEAVSAPLMEEDLSELNKTRDSLLARLAARSADSDAARTRMAEAEQRCEAARTRLSQAEKRLDHAGASEEARERRLANLDMERAQAARLREKSEADLEQAQNQVEDQKRLLDGAAEEKKEMLNESFRLSESARDARSNASAATELAHQAEIQRARLDAQRAATQQRLLEEYGVTEEEALDQAPGLEVPADAGPLVSRLRKELKSLGEVNLGAIEAYERLTERYDELNVQRTDILESKAEVEAAIRELDKLTRERFRSTFEALQGEFSLMFGKLFEGGVGHLSLTSPDDLLATGVEVEVVLPGKKKQRLELLSGGERSLSACAFLFALLRVKASPLVVLDEVDAPLDGRNVERFLSVLREFKGTTQFILITHNPVTIESAPIWLGITMQEPGVTSVIPCKAPEAALVTSRAESTFLKG